MSSSIQLIRFLKTEASDLLAESGPHRGWGVSREVAAGVHEGRICSRCVQTRPPSPEHLRLIGKHQRYLLTNRLTMSRRGLCRKSPT